MYAKRALARGDDPEEVIRRIADFRSSEKRPFVLRPAHGKESPGRWEPQALNAASITLAGETVSSSGAAGVFAGYGANLNVQFSTITSNDGAAGIRVVEHSTLRLIDSTVSGNLSDGVNLESSSAGTFENFGLGSTITGNAGVGVLVLDQSFGDFSNGPNTITGNLGALDVACFGQFPVTLSAKTLIGGTTNCPN